MFFLIKFLQKLVIRHLLSNPILLVLIVRVFDLWILILETTYLLQRIMSVMWAFWKPVDIGVHAKFIYVHRFFFLSLVLHICEIWVILKLVAPIIWNIIYHRFLISSVICKIENWFGKNSKTNQHIDQNFLHKFSLNLFRFRFILTGFRKFL